MRSRPPRLIFLPSAPTFSSKPFSVCSPGHRALPHARRTRARCRPPTSQRQRQHQQELLQVRNCSRLEGADYVRLPRTTDVLQPRHIRVRLPSPCGALAYRLSSSLVVLLTLFLETASSGGFPPSSLPSASPRHSHPNCLIFHPLLWALLSHSRRRGSSTTVSRFLVRSTSSSPRPSASLPSSVSPSSRARCVRDSPCVPVVVSVVVVVVLFELTFFSSLPLSQPALYALIILATTGSYAPLSFLSIEHPRRLCTCQARRPAAKTQKLTDYSRKQLRSLLGTVWMARSKLQRLDARCVYSCVPKRFVPAVRSHFPSKCVSLPLSSPSLLISPHSPPYTLSSTTSWKTDTLPPSNCSLPKQVRSSLHRSLHRLHRLPRHLLPFDHLGMVPHQGRRTRDAPGCRCEVQGRQGGQHALHCRDQGPTRSEVGGL